MTEFELFQALRPFYPAREYALLPQVANGTGAGAFRHCDALALSLWPSRGLHLHGFEIKSYRADWIREMHNPEKAEEIAQYCNHWWIVAGNLAIVKVDELPQPWGLMAWDEKKVGLVKIKSAPFREALKPDLPFLAAALRKAQETVTPDAALAEARTAGREEGKADAEVHNKYELDRYSELKQRVKDFEKASGIKMDQYIPGIEIGEAVNQVLNGTVMRERKALLEIAERIVKDLASTAGSGDAW
jgi:hypothetical protein